MEIRQQILSLFTPTTPINTTDLFAGRQEQIKKVMDSFYEKGRHIILYGERGVGKTSISNNIKNIVENGQAGVALYYFSNAEETFDTLWQGIFRGLPFITQTNSIGFASAVKTDIQPLSNFVQSNLTENDILRYLQMYQYPPLIIIIDEFDKLKDSITKQKMAHVIKLFSDTGANVTLMIVGVGEDILALIDGHESIKRNIVEIKMPRMSSDELKQILDSRLEKIGFTLNEDVKEKIIELSNGLPEYVHSFGKYCALSALEKDKTVIDIDDVMIAVQNVIDNADHSLKEAYNKAVNSNRENTLFGDVLLACTRVQKDDNGKFAQKSIVEPLKNILGREVPIAGFQTHIAKFTEVERGQILERFGKARSYKYRFREPRMHIYITMKGLLDKK